MGESASDGAVQELPVEPRRELGLDREPPRLFLLLVLAAGAVPGYLVNDVIGAVLGGMISAALFLMVWERRVAAFALVFTLLGFGMFVASLWYIARNLPGR